jgi:tetraacyldisaccharide 4'-kinase
VRRRLDVPAGVHAIGVGGATLGGSGKTPLAIAVARALAETRRSVALVGHAYRAHPSTARVVTRLDDVREVGDEALLAARELVACGVPVVVASRREEAVRFAAKHAAILVIDGLLQAEPRPLARSILALDAHAPWGNARFPPAGNLRAPPKELLAAAGIVAMLRDERSFAPSASRREANTEVTGELERTFGGERTFEVSTRIDRVVDPLGSVTELRELIGRRVGLLLGLARPDRVVTALAHRAIHPATTIVFGDHDVPRLADLTRAVTAAGPLDAWLTTAKCATRLPAAIGHTPVLALDYELVPPQRLISALIDG